MSASAQAATWQGKHGPLLIAEIGGNHEGDFAYAKELTSMAVDSGVDAVKFQLYTGDTLANAVVDPTRNQHFKRFELEAEQHVELAKMCGDAGVAYAASVWDLAMLDWIDSYLSFYKIGSGDLTAHALLREFATRGKPIVLSTGLAALDEVLASLNVLASTNPDYAKPSHIAILQCTSVYPLDKKDANLAAMATLREATGLPVGYSDHTTDGQALRVAACLGAEVLEFHFTDTREGKTFRDHAVSITPAEVGEFTAWLDDLTTLLGDPRKQPLDVEHAEGHVTSFRRAVYLNRALDPGDLVGEADLVLLRPNSGLDARERDWLPGKRASRRIEALEPLAKDDFTIG